MLNPTHLTKLGGANGPAGGQASVAKVCMTNMRGCFTKCQGLLWFFKMEFRVIAPTTAHSFLFAERAMRFVGIVSGRISL